MLPVVRSTVLLAAGLLLLPGVGWGQTPAESPLRLDEPVAEVAADLERFIAERMVADDVPGVALALVRDWQVAWANGFGVANALTRSPVEAGSVFEAASNSKVFTAYLALQLVDAGVLELDAPVSGQLVEPWLTPGGAGERIGFLYLQEALEQASGQPLDSLARARLFEPLGLTSTGFVVTSATRTNAVNGHMRLRNALMIALVPSVLSFVPLFLAASVYRRCSRGTWRPDGRVALFVLAISLVLTTVAVAVVIGGALPNVVLLAASSCAVSCGLVAASAFGLARVTERPAVRFACVALIVVVLWWVVTPFDVPVPVVFSPRASAVGSVRTSAVDLATFLIELGRPRHLGAELSTALRSPQIPINDRFSWGLGPAIQHSAQGDALWQMGITPGFRSVMLIYPDHGLGVVVMANSSDALPLVYAVAARAVGGRRDFSDF